jgi:hypothetical protein
MINDGRHSLKLMFATANAVCNRFVAVTAECDQVGETFLTQSIRVVKKRRPRVFVVNLQVFATAASLTAMPVSVKPFLALFGPCRGNHVLAIAISAWLFHCETWQRKVFMDSALTIVATALKLPALCAVSKLVQIALGNIGQI